MTAKRDDYPQTDVVPTTAKRAMLVALAMVDGPENREAAVQSRDLVVKLTVRIVHLKGLLLATMFARAILVACSAIGMFMLGISLAARWPGKQAIPWPMFLLMATFSVGFIVAGLWVSWKQWRENLKECKKDD